MGPCFYQGSGIKILGKKGLKDQNNGKKIGISGSRIYHVTTLKKGSFSLTQWGIGRSRTYLKDCFWLAGKTLGIVTSRCPYPWKQSKCRVKGTSEIRGLTRCRTAGAGTWWQWGRSGKDISSETQGRLVSSGKEGGENFQELAREPLGCFPQQTSSTTRPNPFLWFGTKIQFETSNIIIIIYELIVRSLTWEWSAAHYNYITLKETNKR